MWLEHVNLTVSDLDAATKFYGELLGLKVRWRREPDAPETPAVHLGDDRSYLALFQADPSKARRLGEPEYSRVGFNHVGFVIDDLDAKVAWLARRGIEAEIQDEYEPGRRAYFIDPDGFEVELVEYQQADQTNAPARKKPIPPLQRAS